MSFLSGLFGRKKQTQEQVLHIEGEGDYDLDVVGESHYQDALLSICGRRTAESQRKQVVARLVHEDTNPHDNQAIRVEIGGKTVGYLSREEARSLRQELVKLGHPGITVECDAIIVGGWDKGAGDTGHFGVRLDLPVDDD